MTKPALVLEVSPGVLNLILNPMAPIKKFTVLVLLSFLFGAALLLFNESVLAFSFFGQEPLVGSSSPFEVQLGGSVVIQNIDEKRLYVVFAPQDVAEDGSGWYCSRVSGQELLEDSDLQHYGTCFVNDPGEFLILELSDLDINADYQSMKNSPYFLEERKIEVSSIFPL
ncbi:MAG: hypothetical protein AAB567_02315 [Patescibacteria group bacterium]